MSIEPNQSRLIKYLSVLKLFRSYLSINKDPKKIYIDGELDGYQTDYERNSNNANIGVLARSDIEAKMLLTFLRIITDKNWYYLDNVVWMQLGNTLYQEENIEREIEKSRETQKHEITHKDEDLGTVDLDDSDDSDDRDDLNDRVDLDDLDSVVMTNLFISTILGTDFPYVNTYDTNQSVIEYELTDGTHIKNVSEIDLWNYDRITKYFWDLLE